MICIVVFYSRLYRIGKLVDFEISYKIISSFYKLSEMSTQNINL